MKYLKAPKSTELKDWEKSFNYVFTHLGEYTITDKLYRSFMNDAIRLEQRPNIIANRGMRLENEVRLYSGDDDSVRRLAKGILWNILYSKHFVTSEELRPEYFADGIKAWVGEGYGFADLQLYYYLKIMGGLHNAYRREQAINVEYYFYIKPKEV